MSDSRQTEPARSESGESDFKGGIIHAIAYHQSEIAGLRTRQKRYAEQLASMMRDLHGQIEGVISFPPEVLNENCSAAYLGSDAVVVMFDQDRGMRTRPLRAFPVDIMASISQACLPEINKRMETKAREEDTRLSAINRVTGELEKVHGSLLKTGVVQSLKAIRELSRVEEED